MANDVKLENKAVDFNKLNEMLGGHGLTDEEKKIYGNAETSEPEAEEADDVPEDDVQDEDDGAIEDVDTVEDEFADDESDDGEESGSTDAVAKDTPAKQPAEQKKPAKNLTPEQRRIIELKKNEKELMRKLSEYESKEKIAQFTEEYGKVTDADTAKLFAQSRLQTEQAIERAALSDFKIDNFAVLSKYGAMEDASIIKAACEKVDMTVEEYCIAKYSKREPVDIARSKAAARGQLPSTANKADYAVANASNASGSKKGSALTPEQRRLKERLEALGFQNITPEEAKRAR